MTQNVDALALGGAHIYVAKSYVGQVKGTYIDQAITKQTHDNNYGLERVSDHVLVIRRAYTIGWTFEEINPKNANILCGSPGYSAVPFDRSLPGPRKDLSLLSTSYRIFDTEEYPHLLLDNDGVGVWVPMIYPISEATNCAADLDRPVIAVENTDFTGTILGWRAIVVTGALAGPPCTCETLPSDIAIYPYSALTDDITVTVNLPLGTHTSAINIYQAEVTRLADGQYQFDGPFQLLDDYTCMPVTAPQTKYDGTTGSPLGPDSDISTGIEPPITITMMDACQLNYYSWPEDFLFDPAWKAGSAVKASPGSTIPDGALVAITYKYNTENIRELPLGPTGKNPIVPLTMDFMFPNNIDKIVWHFFKAQVMSNMRFASNPDDWMGSDFVCETMDASSTKPNYAYGYMQFIGPMAEKIVECGNYPYGVDQILGSNQTSWS